MRTIKEIIVHCSATPEGRDVKTETVRGWHVNERGWSDIGYHWVVELDGSVNKGRDESRSGAHAKGHNRASIGVCYIGGVDADMKAKDTRTDKQKEALHCLIMEDLKGRYPDAVVLGHNDISSKACPSFNAKEEYNGG
tara:strand:+ start:1043 stop:1456 length:414 start_codon:yes stop_codon:yes gene_type:complete